MSLPDLRVGLVIRYGYLWRREADASEDAARKDRPAAIVLAAPALERGAKQVYVVPITTRRPSAAQAAIEIPAAIQRRLGLGTARCWIVCDETNTFRWPGFDLTPVPGTDPKAWAYGMLPPTLFEKVRTLFVECGRRKRLQVIPRD